LDEIGPFALLLRRVVTATAATAFAAAPALTATPARTTRTAASGATRAPATTTATRTAASAATARGPTTESTTLFSHLELQPAFAGSVGHRLHAAVVLVTCTVEHDLRDPGRLRLLG